MIDDGQFGQAVVLTQFNYARGYSEGGEVKLKYYNGDFRAYANLAFNVTRASRVTAAAADVRAFHSGQPRRWPN
jgi:hypothetical protein